MQRPTADCIRAATATSEIAHSEPPRGLRIQTAAAHPELEEVHVLKSMRTTTASIRAWIPGYQASARAYGGAADAVGRVPSGGRPQSSEDDIGVLATASRRDLSRPLADGFLVRVDLASPVQNRGVSDAVGARWCLEGRHRARSLLACAAENLGPQLTPHSQGLPAQRRLGSRNGTPIDGAMHDQDPIVVDRLMVPEGAETAFACFARVTDLAWEAADEQK